MTEAHVAGVQKILNAGESIETAHRAMGKALREVLTDTTPVFVDDPLRNAPKMLRQRRRNHRGFGSGHECTGANPLTCS
jgi:hypothetical protein